MNLSPEILGTQHCTYPLWAVAVLWLQGYGCWCLKCLSLSAKLSTCDSSFIPSVVLCDKQGKLFTPQHVHTHLLPHSAASSLTGHAIIPLVLPGSPPWLFPFSPGWLHATGSSTSPCWCQSLLPVVAPDTPKNRSVITDIISIRTASTAIPNAGFLQGQAK